MKTFAAAAASLLLAMPAMALPKLSVTYRDAALTVSPTDDIEIWVHVESSTPIDSSLGAPFGFEAADLPKTATLFGSRTPIAFASYTSINVFPVWSCVSGCKVAGYADEFFMLSTPDKPAFWSTTGSEVVPGDYLAAVYRPIAGETPASSFTIPVIPSLNFNVTGLSASGTVLSAYLGPANGFAACSASTIDQCGVKVTVQAVPEPSTWALMALGMTALVATRRRLTA
jgi:hypothetical protein